jgi:hypothetical protein
MWSVQRPAVDAGDTFRLCVSKVRDGALRRRLLSVRPDVEAAAADYEAKAATGHLYQIAASNIVGGVVTRDEMVTVYDRRMAAKNGAGRAIYDRLKLLPEGDRCPFCDQRNVSTLDHILPKAVYPVLAVAPLNLVGACWECNKVKLAAIPTTAEDTVLHPYFDDISQDQWLKATVVQQQPCALTFDVRPPAKWDATKTARAIAQFNLLGLAALYASEAAREIANIRHNLRMHFNAGGATAVENELRRQWQSRYSNRINSWQTATYDAIAHDHWFYNGGFL